MTSPADKATDDVRGLVERLRAFADHLEPAADMYGQEIADVRSAAATLTSLLERAERAERRAEELADGLMYVTVDHTGCIYTTADEDRAIKLAKDNLVEAERNARERAERERDEVLTLYEEERERHMENVQTQGRHINEATLRAERAERERDEAAKSLGRLTRRVTPKPIRYAPRDPNRVIIGAERPPQEDQTFFYEVIWCEERKQFVAPFTRALNGATHFLDPRNMIGIVWPHERRARTVKGE